jgi:hypothetical protein
MLVAGKTAGDPIAVHADACCFLMRRVKRYIMNKAIHATKTADMVIIIGAAIYQIAAFLPAHQVHFARLAT